MSVFDELNERVSLAAKEFSLNEPTKPQQLAIPKILEGKHVLLIAPTGTGKTEAALLPIFSMCLSQRQPLGIKILYIAPLRALNRDMLTRLTQWAKALGLTIAVRHGDTAVRERELQAKQPPDMLITTPETLQAIMPGKRMREHLKTVRWVIVDEIHELAEDKRGAQLSIGLERLAELAGEYQRVGLSATIGSPRKVAKFLVGSSRDVEIVDASDIKEMKISVECPMPSEGDVELAEKLFTGPTMAARLRRLRELINKHGSTLIFVNTREMAEILGSRLRLLDPSCSVGVHHGSLSKEVRIEAEESFRSERLKGLICTSSMELGIDIGAVDLVVQYMSPRQVTRLVQRVGRSGHRVGEPSVGVILAADPDDIMEAAVISKRTLEGALESSKVHEGALDVLAHQLVGLSLDKGSVGIDEALALVRQTYPYRNISRGELVKVLEQLDREGLVRLLGEKFERNKAGWRYYFSNLSMIPDVRRYTVDDLASRRSVGTLDEEFIVAHGEPGVSFICKGETWQVVEVDAERGRVLVEPVDDPLGAIPAWEGELIPVPFEVAQEVGLVRKTVARLLKQGARIEEVATSLAAKYPVSRQAAGLFVEYIRKYLEEGLPLPTDDRVVAEIYGQFLVLHACFGSSVNETLARVLAPLFSARFGASIAIKVDPYRIALKFPTEIDENTVKETLRGLKPELIEPILTLTLKDSPMYRWRLVHVAKRFGAIRRDAELTKLNLRRLARAFEGTPIYEETMREIMFEKLDINKAKEVANLLCEGKIELAFVARPSSAGPTIIGWPILNELSAGELVVPKRAESEILRALKRRLNQHHVRLFCMNCLEWSALTKVERLPELPKCGKCGARLLTILPREHRQVMEIIRKRATGKRLSEDERRLAEKARRMADLILTYGKRAVLALCGRGIGPRTAARILAMGYKDEDDFYRAILYAERQFARTRQFWG